MVPCTRSTQPLVCGRPAWMKRCFAPRNETVCPEARARNSEPLNSLAMSAALGDAPQLLHVEVQEVPVGRVLVAHGPAAECGGAGRGGGGRSASARRRRWSGRGRAPSRCCVARSRHCGRQRRWHAPTPRGCAADGGGAPSCGPRGPALPAIGSAGPTSRRWLGTRGGVGRPRPGAACQVTACCVAGTPYWIVAVQSAEGASAGHAARCD